MLERLDFKTARFDRLSDSVLIDGRKITIEILREAFEVTYLKSYTGEEAVIKAMKEGQKLNRLANLVPADDGKIHITAALMLGGGQFGHLQTLKNLQE